MSYKVGERMSENNRRKAEDAKRRIAGFESDVTFASMADAPAQTMKWHCPKCGVDWPTFKEFLYDGCSPVYGIGTNKRLEGI